MLIVGKFMFALWQRARRCRDAVSKAQLERGAALHPTIVVTIILLLLLYFTFFCGFKIEKRGNACFFFTKRARGHDNLASDVFL